MPACARKEIVREGEVGIYHCVSRCVRRAFLCGRDPMSGQSFEHRRGWVQDRLELLAANWGVDVCGFAVMGNHLHVMLRTRPDVVARWSDEEVARRWWQVFPRRRNKNGSPAEPEEHELRMLMADLKVAEERRRRMASVSWFMRCLCEYIARRANKEDRCSGRFWEGRFKCQALLDENAVLACSVYVDLNPIRAGLCTTPEQSEYTSAYQQIHARNARRRKGKTPKAPQRSKRRKRLSRRDDDAWLCPISATSSKGGRAKTAVEKPEASPPRRASWHGFLSLRLNDYLRLLDWTGRQVRRDKRGSIPKDLAPILDRVGVNGEVWVESVAQFGRWFRRAVGSADRVSEAATTAGRHWFHGLTHSRTAFG